MEIRDVTIKPPPPPLLPLNRDPKRAIEQAISVLNTIIERHPEVRRDFDCESFIHHELSPALEAAQVEPNAEVITQLRQLFDKTAEAHDGDYADKVSRALVAVYAFGRRQTTRPEVVQQSEEVARLIKWHDRMSLMIGTEETDREFHRKAVNALRSLPSPLATSLATGCPHCGAAPGALCRHAGQPCMNSCLSPQGTTPTTQPGSADSSGKAGTEARQDHADKA